jgi:hypothetical protein
MLQKFRWTTRTKRFFLKQHVQPKSKIAEHTEIMRLRVNSSVVSE